jgi:hypothetical protein
MAYVYKNGEWKPTIEPVDDSIIVYTDYPDGYQLNPAITNTEDKIYTT